MAYDEAFIFGTTFALSSNQDQPALARWAPGSTFGGFSVKKNAIGYARNLRRALLAVSALVCVAPAALAYNMNPDYFEDEGGIGVEGPSGPIGSPSPDGAPPVLSFKGISQGDVRFLHGGFSEIPPDTMGAVGTTQFMETTNGAYAIYDKKTGARTALMTDGSFWAAAGIAQPPGSAGFSNGDSRVLFDAKSKRWIVESFGTSLQDIQIAVSTTSDATGPWQATVFHGFLDGHGTGVADYPTLAIDNKAVYIGTNDFTQTSGACPISFCGTTLNVIARSDLFGAGAPTTTSLKQFFTPYGSDEKGFAIQGVNQIGGNDSGKVIAVGALNYGLIRYNVNNPGTAGATQTPTVLLDTTPYDPNDFARQPNHSRNIDTLDDRVSSAAWELNGRIYAVHTITPTGTDHTAVQWYVVDAATNTVIQEGLIGGNGDGYDYYQATIVVNKNGQAVISYNRSGETAGDGNISIFADIFDPIAGGNGALKLRAEQLLHVSPIDNYHNGSIASAPPAGRQRWGDYAQVTVDPNNPFSFWIVGEYANPYDSPTSGSRWGTWIAQLDVPEPMTLSLFGMGLAGAFGARRRAKRSKQD